MVLIRLLKENPNPTHTPNLTEFHSLSPQIYRKGESINLSHKHRQKQIVKLKLKRKNQNDFLENSIQQEKKKQLPWNWSIQVGIPPSRDRHSTALASQARIMSFLKFWVKSKKKKKDLPPEVLADNGSVFLPGEFHILLLPYGSKLYEILAFIS